MSYLIKTFRGGISDETNKGVIGACKNSYALDIHKRTDSLTCKQAMLNVTPTGMNDLGMFAVPATDGSLYVFGNAGSIWALSGDLVWTYLYTDGNGGIKGAAEWQDNTGADYLFWATATAIARKQIQGNGVVPWTDATQVFKTENILAQPGDKPTWHTMKNAMGQLNIANGNTLATYGFDTTWSQSALNVRPGHIIKTLEERDDYIIIGSYKSDDAEEGYIWSWITTATNWVQKKRVPIKGVNAMINAEILLCQGGVEGELYYTDFVNSLPLHGIVGSGQCCPGGVTIESGRALFGVYGGTNPGLWSYGRKRKNRPMAMNYDYRLSGTVNGSTVSTIGFVVMFGGTLYASYGTTDGSTSEYRVDSISSSTKANAIFEGLEFDGGQPWVKKNFNNVRLTMSPLPSGASVSARIKNNYEANWRYLVLGDGTTTYTGTGIEVEAEFTNVSTGMIYEVGLDLNSTGNSSPEIIAIHTDMNPGGYGHG